MIFEENNRKILPKMKKNIGVITLLFFLFSFGNATEHALFPNQEKSINDCLKQIKHIYRPFQTIELNYRHETPNSNDSTWYVYARGSVIADFRNKNYVARLTQINRMNPKLQIERTVYAYNGQNVIVPIFYNRDGELRKSKDVVRIDDVDIRNAVSLASQGTPATYLATLQKVLSTLEDYKLEIIKENNILLLKMSSQNVSFFFNLERGLLVRREKFIVVKGRKTKSSEDEYKYAEIDGWTFPTMINEVYYDPDTQKELLTRIIIDPQDIKINKPIDDTIFIPKIPAGALVKDEINKRTYRASGISNEKKEEIIAKELDRIFEEAQQKK